MQPSLVRVGQELSFHLALSGTTGTWNLALFVEDPEGHIDQLLPNRTQSGSGSIQGGTTAVFPEKDANLFLMAASPAGVHTVLAYASPKPLYLSSISTYRDGDVFATVNANRQGKGSLDGSLLAVLGLTNPGVYALSTLTVAP